MFILLGDIFAVSNLTTFREGVGGQGNGPDTIIPLPHNDDSYFFII